MKPTDNRPPADPEPADNRPTTGAMTEKLYRCKRCGHEQRIATNHFGECYSYGHYNTCPACPPWANYPEFGGLTVWICVEPCPPEMAVPEPWKPVTITIRQTP